MGRDKVFTLKLKVWQKVFLIVAIFVVSGSVTLDSLQQKYPWYTVVGKEKREIIRDAPVWLFSCVAPSGIVRCSVESVAACEDCYANPGVNSCTISCNEKHGDKWIKRKIGTKKSDLIPTHLKIKITNWASGRRESDAIYL